MRRFLLTSEKFTGTAEVWYDFEGVLCHISLIDCCMNYTQIKYLLQNLSPEVAQFHGMMTGSNVKIEEKAFELTLDDFKREYPYSRNYHLLNDIWPKLTLKVQVKAYFAAIQYRKYCDRNKHWGYKPKIAAAWFAKEEYKNDWRKM
jgi:hypothetical protein